MEELLERVQKNEWAWCLEYLLERWRAQPEPEIATTIELLGTALVRGKASLQGKAAVEEWLTAVETAGPEDLTVLLAAMIDVGAEHAARRLDALKDWPEDPRFQLAMAHWLHAIPYRSNVGQKFLRRLLKRAKKTRDVRALPVLRELDALFVHDFDTANGQWLRDRVAKDLAPVMARLAASVSRLSDEDKAILSRCDELLVATEESRPTEPRSAEAQLGRVLADPASDDERLVYADVLSEVGDIHGEFIVLQMKAKPTTKEKRRIKAILKEHGSEFLGPLGEVVLKKNRVFRRGFLAECAIKSSSLRTLNRLALHPGWATVEHASGPLEILLSPAMSSLRWAEPERGIDVEALCVGRGSKTIERLGLDSIDASQTQALASCDALPSLRHLCIDIRQLQAVVDGAVWSRLEVLDADSTWHIQPGALQDWIAIFTERGPGPRVVGLEFNAPLAPYTRYRFEYHLDANKRYVGPILTAEE